MWVTCLMEGAMEETPGEETQAPGVDDSLVLGRLPQFL